MRAKRRDGGRPVQQPHQPQRRVGDFADRLKATLRDTWDRDPFDHLVNNAGHGD